MIEEQILVAMESGKQYTFKEIAAITPPANVAHKRNALSRLYREGKINHEWTENEKGRPQVRYVKP
jgi:hypothetical protein